MSVPRVKQLFLTIQAAYNKTIVTQSSNPSTPIPRAWQGSCFSTSNQPKSTNPNTTMKSLKYTLIIGLLSSGMASLAHATLSGPTSQVLANNGMNTELTAFRNFSGHQDAEMCVVQSPGNETVTNSFGTFTFINLPFNPITGHFEVQVTFTMNPGNVVCGFLTKNGAGNLVFLYTVSADEGLSGTFTLEVP